MARSDGRLRFLRSVYFFESLGDAELEALLPVCREERFAAGEVVCSEGDAADRFYMVMEGRLDVLKEAAGGGEELLAEHGEGGLFGEMALVDDLPRSATVRARTAARLLAIGKAEFQRIVAADARIALCVLRSLSAMVRASNETYVEALRRRNAELERLYDDLKRSQAEALRNDRLAALGRFASLIVHDIRNPIASVRAWAELILHNAANRERVEESARTIVREADRLSGLATELLDFARGEISLSLGPVSLGALIGQVLDRLRDRFAGAKIEVDRDIGFDGPVLLDERRMQRILHNLADNAVKAMPRGGRLAVRTAADAGRYTILISDTGVGMSGDIQRRLFEPFFSAFEGGTGLGMAIARSIVRAHGGELTARSAEGAGTTFAIDLPARPEEHR